MSLEAKGKITAILPIETVNSKSGKQWNKRNFTIDTGAEYNPMISFQLFGDDNIKAFENFRVNEEVNVSFNLSSREHNGSFYHNVDAWKIESLSSAPATQEDKPSAPKSFDDAIADDDSSDVPF